MLALSFGNPWLLTGLLLPVALIGWAWTRQQRRLALPFDHSQARRGRLWRGLLQSGE